MSSSDLEYYRPDGMTIDDLTQVPARSIEDSVVKLFGRYPEGQVRVELGEDGDWSISLWEDHGLRWILLGDASADSVTGAFALLADAMDER